VAFSLANEPNAAEDGALEYLTDVFAYARTFIELPLVFVNCTEVNSEKCCHLSDFLLINRYYAWYYRHHGELEDVEKYLRVELEEYAKKYGKPILFSEFGADTIEGNHSLSSETFSEEFQMEFIAEHCKLFDSLDYVIGEHVWAFADFKTKQGLTRVRGNRKGVFTKERQPKMAAHWLKMRWENK
jgi:beta-glucuronidase